MDRFQNEPVLMITILNGLVQFWGGNEPPEPVRTTGFIGSVLAIPNRDPGDRASAGNLG